MIVIVSPRMTIISPSAVIGSVLNVVNESRIMNTIGTQYDFLMMYTPLGRLRECSLSSYDVQGDFQRRGIVISLLRFRHQFIILFLGFYSPIECTLLDTLFRGVHMLNNGTMVRIRKRPFLDQNKHDEEFIDAISLTPTRKHDIGFS